MSVVSPTKYQSPAILKRCEQLEYTIGRCELALKFINSAGFTTEVSASLTASWLGVESISRYLLNSLLANGEHAEREALFRLEYQILPQTLLLQRGKVDAAIQGIRKSDRLLCTWSFIWRDFSISDF